MLNRRQLMTTGTAAAAALSAPAFAVTATPVSRLNDIFTRVFDETVAASPSLATSLGLDKDALAPLKSKLDDRSPKADAEEYARTKAAITAISAIKRTDLTGMDRVNYDTVLWSLKIRQEGADHFKYGLSGAPRPYSVNQLSGAFYSVPDFLANQHTVTSKADAEAYVARVSAFATALDQDTARVKADAAKGVIAPDFIIKSTLGNLRKLRAIKGADSAMTKALSSKTKDKGIEGDWGTQTAGLIDGPVAAALDRQIAAFEALAPKAVHDAGVWRLPDGEAFYNYAARYGTTTSLTPEEIHKVGLDLVASISAEADTKLKALGYTQGTVGERMKALGDDPKYLYANTDEAKEKLLLDLNHQIDAVMAKLPGYFGTLPKTKVVVRRVPKEIEAGAPGGYYQRPSLDGARPGAYYINLRDTAEWPSWSLPTLTYHEAIPGHHMQISIQMEAKDLPRLRRIGGFSAFSEGWGLYAELLAGEMGMYDTDPVGYIGYLQSSLFRAIRLVVDTGMHAKRWSREQAISYFVATNGDAETAATTEVERYVAWPGQALSYMIGKLQWQRLREAARAKAGAAFDIKAFHDAGLVSGPVPLAVLEQLYRDKGFIA